MIDEIVVSSLDKLVSLFDEYNTYLEKNYGNASFPPVDKVKQFLEQDDVKIFAHSSGGDNYDGFYTFNHSKTHPYFGSTATIFALESPNRLEIEKNLFGFLFDHFRGILDWITVWGFNLQDDLLDHVIQRGFIRVVRSKMTIDREKVNSLQQPPLHGGFSFTDWQDAPRKGLVEIVSAINTTGIDASYVPIFDDAELFIDKLMESTWGKFDDKLARVLMLDNAVTGFCIVTMVAGDTGYIPDIAIAEDHQGKGLGKALLIHALKKAFDTNPSIEKINLDVTQNNLPAYPLYEKTGFKLVRDYSVLTWKRNDSQ